MQLATDLGYCGAFAECTSVASKESCTKHFPFSEKAKVDYATFEYNGTFPFKQIDPKNPSCTLVEILWKEIN